MNKLRRTRIWLLAVPLVVLSSALIGVGIVLAQGSVQNGSFETGTLTGPIAPFYQTLGVGATNIPDWNIVGGTIDYSASAIWLASDGDKSLDMDGLSLPGSINQQITTDPGQVYEVKFDMAGNPAGPPIVKKLQACAGSTCQTFTFGVPFPFAFVNGQDLGWVEKSFLFPATAMTTTLTFSSLTTGSNCSGIFCNSWGPTLDNVRVGLGPDKVDVCHVSKGKKNGDKKTKTLNISRNAVGAHLGHGDTFGSC